MFILTNVWMNGKNSMKRYYLKKEDFYSHLNPEDITDTDYTHAKRVCRDSEIKKFRRMSWFVSSKQYIIVNWCIWEL